jgi:AcrR family transcriptional regulator
MARHYREAEGLSIAQIAERLGRSPATIKAYFYDPTGEKAKAVKARYQGVCRGCGAYTQARNGKGDAYAYCKACHPGAIERRWTHQGVLDAMGAWSARHGRLPSSYDWSRTHARRRGENALERLAEGEWPSASVVTSLFGTWAAARMAASGQDVQAPTRQA